MAEVGYATLGIIPSFDGFQGKLESGTNRAMLAAGTSGGTRFGDSAGKSAGQRFGSVFKTAAKASLIGLAGAGALAFKFGSDAVSAASDLEESTNKVQQIFGGNADAIFKFSERAADALGQTNTQAREAAATFGIFAGAAGMSDQKSAKFAKRMTVLASDLASFNNTEPEEAVQALGAALRGESEPIRAYGVMLDEATLKAEALKQGLLEPVRNEAQISAAFVDMMEAQKEYNKVSEKTGAQSLATLDAEAALGLAKDKLTKATEGTIPPLTQQQKLLAAQSVIFKQTSVAQGDFARTSDGLANQQRRLSARFEDAKAKLGAGLLPIMTDAADFLLDKGIPAFEDFSQWFNDEGIPKLKEFGGFVKDDVIPVVKDLAEFAGDAAGVLGDVVGAINKLPSAAKLSVLTGLLAGGAAVKVAGRGGALSAAGSVLGAAKPIPVFVTNPGFGAVSGGTPGGVVAGGGTSEKAAKAGRFSKLATFGKVFIPVTLFAAGYELGGKEFAKGFKGGGAAGISSGEYSIMEGAERADVIRGELESGLGAMVDESVSAAAKIVGEFDKLPKTLQSRFQLLGIPESEKELRHLLRVYDLTPREKRTTLELMGYDVMLDRLARINRELDWVARPREARISITKAYSAAGYETRGGLVEGGGGPVERNRSRAGGGLG